MGPFHEGERRLQAAAGTVQVALRNAAILSATLAPGAARFLPEQRMLAVATLDADGQPWASLVEGERGFAVAVDARTVALERRSVEALALAAGDEIGLLAIELATRRRYRINGRVSEVGDRVRIEVREAFSNCPQHIVRRSPIEEAPTPAGGAGDRLDDLVRERIARADTLFVASRHPGRGLDVSHRGGPRGFALADERGLLVPDYPGNGMFQTLGNVAVDPRVGVAIPDLEQGGVLQLVGRAEVLHDQPDPGGLTRGSGRFWRMHVARWRVVGSRLRWSSG